MKHVLTDLPGTFIRDCLDSDCAIGEASFDKRGLVTLEASAEELAELRSRAEYYADPWGPDGSGLSGLKSSARALLKRLPV